MTIKLVTDSTCDLPPALIDRHEIQIVPINIQFGENSYQENVTISPDFFYRTISATGVLPKTSQPASGEFAAVYQSLANETDEIISIHVTGKLSGTCQSARLAAAAVADQVQVHVIDSEAGSAGLGWMLLEATDLINQGLSADEIITHLESKRNRISIYFAVDNLQYASLSGRVGKISAALGTLLNIKPIIGLTDGFINVTDRVRSNNAAIRRMVTLTSEKVGNQPVNIGIIHAQAAEQAALLMPMVQDQLRVEDCYIKDLAMSLAVHFGPGTLGLVAYPVNSSTFP